MGMMSKIISAASRFMALASSTIVAGLLGRFVAHLHDIGYGGGSRVIYALALSGISIFFALLLLIPFKFTFWSFPLDLAMFIMWIVAFGLLTNLSRGCGGLWYRWVWSFSWGGRYCNIWRTILAFSFIAAMAWLLNAMLGVYRSWKDRKEPAGVATNGANGAGKRGLFGRKGAAGNQPMAESGERQGMTNGGQHAGETV